MGRYPGQQHKKCFSGHKASVLQIKEAEAQAAERAKEAEKEAIIAAERERMLAEAGALKVYIPQAALSSEPKLPPLMPACLD